MQVFIIGTPFYTAVSLDKKRLHKQIVECNQILDTLNGRTNAWKNHPCVLQYKEHQEWLKCYALCLTHFKNGDIEFARLVSDQAKAVRPEFHTLGYFLQMKRRLYTKDPVFYERWGYLGESEVNWYFVNGAWRYYKNGKQVKDRQ